MFLVYSFARALFKENLTHCCWLVNHSEQPTTKAVFVQRKHLNLMFFWDFLDDTWKCFNSKLCHQHHLVVENKTKIEVPPVNKEDLRILFVVECVAVIKCLYLSQL